MVKKSMYQKIIKLKGEGKSKKEISRQLRMDIKTVSKYFNIDEKEYREIQNQSMYRSKLFDKYIDEILEVYEINKNSKLNVSSVYDFLEEAHGALPGTEKTLRNFVDYLLKTNRLEFEENIRIYKSVPELPPGKQLQLDFGEYLCSSGLRVYIFAAVLSSSRYKYSILQDRPFRTLDVIKYLLSCFDYIGGIPEELVIDQDRLMVVSENHGDIIYTKDFGYFREEMNLKMHVCRKADPESKGKVENMIKYIKNNFFGTRDFQNIEEANESLSKWLSRRANGKICQATKQIPAIMIEAERENLRPVRNSIFRKDSLIGRETRQANDKSLISVLSNQYLLPSKYKNREVEVYITGHKLFVFDSHDGKEIAEYDLSLMSGKIISRREFRRLTEISLKELKKQVSVLFPCERWNFFLNINFKTYRRYVRDQCIEGLKYFSGEDIDIRILDIALEYCLENKTYSVANLKDTYRHFLHISEKGDALFDKDIFNLQEKIDKHEPVNVKKRDLSLYKSILSNKEAS